MNSRPDDAVRPTAEPLDPPEPPAPVAESEVDAEEQARLDAAVGLNLGSGVGAAFVRPAMRSTAESQWEDPALDRDIGAGAPATAFDGGVSDADKTVPFFNYALILLLGGAPVALVIAWMRKADAPRWVRSHYEFQIRTVLAAFAGLLVALAVINVPAVGLLGALFLVALAVWTLLRAATGLVHVAKGRAHPAPKTWSVTP